MALPSGYTKLEYIESTGTQYIDTGFVPSSKTSVIIDFNSSASSGVIIGQDSGYKVNGFMLAMTVVVFDRAKKDLSISANNRHVVQLDPQNFKIDNGESSVITIRTFNGDYPLFLFGNNRAGSFSEGVPMRLYACQIYNGSAVEFDFVPCKTSAGVVGLWDNVSNKFYSNAGTGSFKADPLSVDLTAHKTLVNGTAYEVKGGKCLVNGTAYSIKKGRTLIGGTGYDITFAPPPVHIYGVEWDWTSSGATRGVRTDDAANFPEPSPAVSNGNGSSPFDDLYPWCDMVRENRAGGVEVKEPKYWFKWTKTDKKLKLQIADAPVDGFSVDPVNRDRGDGLGELDYSYIGRYHCASSYKSTTGAAQLVNITRSQARSGIHNLGANFWQMDFAQFWYVNMLFLVEFADWNGERIGRGCSTSGSKMNNGQTDAMVYHTGTTAASRDSHGFTQYRNIEGWWDNVYDWMDGCYYNSNGLNVITNPNNFSDSANGTLVGKPSSGYPSDFTIPTASGLEWALFPSEANGSVTTYVPDRWVFSGSYSCLRHGGNYYQYRIHGPFHVDCSGASDTSGGIGCRLQERPPKAS